MGWVLALAGVVMLAITALDLARTVFDVGTGAGPISGFLSRSGWRGLLFVHSRRRSHRLLETLGVGIVLSLVGGWLLSVWIGWTLVFSSSPLAVVDSKTGQPVGFWDRAYMVGGGLLSLGNGDFSGGTPAWRLALAATVTSGLLLVTLSITYLVPVIGAASRRRKVAAYISALGMTPQEIVRGLWEPPGFPTLHDHLVALTPMLTELGQDHLAYPVLHFFHSAERGTALAPSVAALDEALTILEHGLEGEVVLPTSVAGLRRALSGSLRALHLFPDRAFDPPPAPALGRLRAHGLPVVSHEQFEAALEPLADRRRLLGALVEEDAWEWKAVVGDGEEETCGETDQRPREERIFRSIKGGADVGAER